MADLPTPNPQGQKPYAASGSKRPPQPALKPINGAVGTAATLQNQGYTSIDGGWDGTPKAATAPDGSRVAVKNGVPQPTPAQQTALQQRRQQLVAQARAKGILNAQFDDNGQFISGVHATDGSMMQTVNGQLQSDGKPNADRLKQAQAQAARPAAAPASLSPDQQNWKDTFGHPGGTPDHPYNPYGSQPPLIPTALPHDVAVTALAQEQATAAHPWTPPSPPSIPAAPVNPVPITGPTSTPTYGNGLATAAADAAYQRQHPGPPDAAHGGYGMLPVAPGQDGQTYVGDGRTSFNGKVLPAGQSVTLLPGGKMVYGQPPSIPPAPAAGSSSRPAAASPAPGTGIGASTAGSSAFARPANPAPAAAPVQPQSANTGITGDGVLAPAGSPMVKDANGNFVAAAPAAPAAAPAPSSVVGDWSNPGMDWLNSLASRGQAAPPLAAAANPTPVSGSAPATPAAPAAPASSTPASAPAAYPERPTPPAPADPTATVEGLFKNLQDGGTGAPPAPPAYTAPKVYDRNDPSSLPDATTDAQMAYIRNLSPTPPTIPATPVGLAPTEMAAAGTPTLPTPTFTPPPGPPPGPPPVGSFATGDISAPQFALNTGATPAASARTLDSTASPAAPSGSQPAASTASTATGGSSQPAPSSAVPSKAANDRVLANAGVGAPKPLPSVTTTNPATVPTDSTFRNPAVRDLYANAGLGTGSASADEPAATTPAGVGSETGGPVTAGDGTSDKPTTPASDSSASNLPKNPLGTKDDPTQPSTASQSLANAPGYGADPASGSAQPASLGKSALYRPGQISAGFGAASPGSGTPAASASGQQNGTTSPSGNGPQVTTNGSPAGKPATPAAARPEPGRLLDDDGTAGGEAGPGDDTPAPVAPATARGTTINAGIGAAGSLQSQGYRNIDGGWDGTPIAGTNAQGQRMGFTNGKPPSIPDPAASTSAPAASSTFNDDWKPPTIPGTGVDLNKPTSLSLNTGASPSAMPTNPLGGPNDPTQPKAAAVNDDDELKKQKGQVAQTAPASQ